MTETAEEKTARGASLRAAAERVARDDRDRFAATMAAPAALRPALWTIHATGLEIARAAWASKEPMIGEMRLQWWTDALEALASEGKVPEHEFGPALAPLTAAVPELLRAVEARRRDCWRQPFAGTEELFSYLTETSGTLYAAAGRALGAAEAEIAPLRDYGTAAGLAAWLRAAPELGHRGWEALPDPAPEAVSALAREAAEKLRTAGREIARGSKAARAAALPGWRTAAVLRRAERNPERVAGGGLDGSEFSRRFSLLRAAFRL